MDKFQYIYNESDNSSNIYITTKYVVYESTTSQWIHRDIEYNAAGIPILKLYSGETKRIYKKYFVNGVETQFNAILNSDLIEDEIISEDVTDKVIKFIKDDELNIKLNLSQNIIEASNCSTTIIPKESFGHINSEYEINDTDLIVIVEETPIVKQLKWNHNNPLIIKNLNEIPLSLSVEYNNGQEFKLSDEVLNELEIHSSNNYSAIVDDLKICPRHLDTKCNIYLSHEKAKLLFGENIPNIESLTLLLSNNISSDLLLTANHKITYLEEIPIMYIQVVLSLTINEEYILTDGRTLRYNINSLFDFSINNNIVELRGNRIKANNTGQAIITATNKDQYAIDIPQEISWNVNVIKTLRSITWSIDKEEIVLNDDEQINDYATISVIAEYDDNSYEDITNSCSFNYNNRIVRIDENKIYAVASGESQISILLLQNNVLNDTETYSIRVVKPITNIDIIDNEEDILTILTNTELNLKVGEEKDLSYVIYPPDATSKEMVWWSTDETIATINNDGHVTILKDGFCNIFVGIKPNEILIDNEDTDREESNVNSIYSSIYASCSIKAQAIRVTDLKLSHSEITTYVGDNDVYYKVEVLPLEAHNKQVSVDVQYDGRYLPFSFETIGENELSIKANKEGTGILTVTSVDNPEVKATINITVIDNTVKKITINRGNDNDYEWYDNTDNVNDNNSKVRSPEKIEYAEEPNSISLSEKTYTIDKITKHEMWDDDDFPRYYCPINNSLQLTANVEPSGASHAELVWYSSDGTLVKCTPSGIITPVRQGVGITETLLNAQTLDMDYADDVNDEGRRFPNTTWVTAFNPQSKKAGVCQVRVTRNNITGFSIGNVPEHDYDADIFDEDNLYVYSQDLVQEYNQDYIIWKDETIILPMALIVQDPNFGPSNTFKWNGHNDFSTQAWTDIIELSHHLPDHSNNDLYNDTKFDWTSKTPAQVNNDKKNLNVNIKGTGLGKVTINAACDDPYWSIPNEVSGITDKYGVVELDNDWRVTVYWLGHVKEFGEGDVEVKIANAKIYLNASRQLFVNVPPIMIKGNYGKTLELFVANKYKDDCDRIKVIVECKSGSNWVPNTEVVTFITAYKKAGLLKQIVDKTNENGIILLPTPNSDEYGNTHVNIYDTTLTRPGITNGEYKTVEDSRAINITVVDTPKKIYVSPLSMSRIVNSSLPSKNLKPVWTEGTRLKIRYKSNRCVPFFIYFDDEFIEELNDFADSNDKCPLNDKYMSFAWFTSDPNVFIPIERSQISDSRDNIDIHEEITGITRELEDGSYTKRTVSYNLKGYGRYMAIQPTGRGKATLTIVNIMSGKSWTRLVEIV